MPVLLLTAPPADWMLFIGRFHPLLVHLPIGFLLIAGLLEGSRRLGLLPVDDRIITTILFWSALGATASCVAGYLLAQGGGYDAELLTEHQWQGIGVAALSWLAWALKSDWLGERIPFGLALYGPVLLLALLLLGVAGHHGGSLTHGTDYLSQYTPGPLRTLAGLPPRPAAVVVKPITDMQQALVYDQLVSPILQSRCAQCHNAEKAKGNLRVDSPDRLRRGGDDGPVLVAGQGASSPMVKRCLLPESDDDHMPPKGKPQLTPEQVALLSWWIDQGAPFDKKVSELTVTDPIKPILAMYGPGQPTTATASVGPAPEAPVLTRAVPPADPAVLATLKQAGLLVLPLATGQNQLEVSAVNNRTFNDAQAAALLRLRDQLVWLKLGSTELTDAGLAVVGQLKNLQKLQLQHTRITDAGLARLADLPNLEYLNLYGTATSDAGLASLARLPRLKTLYLWQTNVTEQGIARLQKAQPKLTIDRGTTPSAALAKTEAR
ncbi:ribonuclease inhibitor [Spirosoma luteolum]